MTDHSQHDPALTRPERPARACRARTAGVDRAGRARRRRRPAVGGAGRRRPGRALRGAPRRCPMGLGVTVVLLAGGLIVARVPRPVGAARDRPARRRAARARPLDARRGGRWPPRSRSIPVLRAAPWVVVPALFAAAALASLAATGGRRWGELGAGLGSLWARLPLGPCWPAARPARGVSVRGAGAGRARRRARLAAARRLRPAAGQRRRRVRPDPRATSRPTGASTAPSGASRSSRSSSPAAARCSTRWCGRSGPRRSRRGRTLGRLEWALPLGALVALFGGFVALQTRDAVRRRAPRARHRRPDLRRVRAHRASRSCWPWPHSRSP